MGKNVFKNFWEKFIFIGMSIETGVHSEIPFWSDSFNEEEVNLIGQFSTSFKNPVKVIESDGGVINLYQRVYRGSDERKIVVKKMGDVYYVITHYNDQYLNSYKLESLSELYHLPDLRSVRHSLFV